MNFHELHACTGRILKGSRRQILRASLLYPAARLFFRIVPSAAAAFLLIGGHLTARELFFGGVPEWFLFSLLWSMLGFCVLLPIRCGTWSWFTSRSGLERTKGKRVFFRRAADYWQGAWYFFRAELLRTAAALPAALGLLGADMAFRAGIGRADAGFELFLTAQCLCLAAAGGVFYAAFCIGTAALPFLFTEHPDGSPFTDMQRSAAILRGHRFQLIRLFLGYLPAAIPVVTIPFLLPHMMMDYTLFIQICIREQEQEDAHADTAIYHGTPAAVQA